VNTCSGGLDALRLLVVGEGESVPLLHLSLKGLDSEASELEGRGESVVVLGVGVEEGVDSGRVEGVAVVLKVAEGLESLGETSVGEAEASRQASEVLLDALTLSVVCDISGNGIVIGTPSGILRVAEAASV